MQLCVKGRPSGLRNGREKREQTNTQTHISSFIIGIDDLNMTVHSRVDSYKIAFGIKRESLKTLSK